MESVRLLVDAEWGPSWVHEPEGTEDEVAFDIPATMWDTYRQTKDAFYRAAAAIDEYIKTYVADCPTCPYRAVERDGILRDRNAEVHRRATGHVMVRSRIER